jgi:potassium efflux system protein
MRALRFSAFLLFLVSLTGAFAQDATTQRQQVEQHRATLERIEQVLQRPYVDQAGLVELRAELDPVVDALRELIVRIEPAKTALEQRMTQLGDAPEEGQQEAPEIARERRELRARIEATDVDLRQSRLLQVRADQLSERLIERRRELFSRELFERSSSILDPMLWRRVGEAMPRLGTSLGFFIQDWFAVLGRQGHALGFVVLALTVALALVLYWPLRKWLIALPYGKRFALGSVETPTAAQRSMVAAWTALVNGLLPAGAALLVAEVLTLLGLVPARFERVTDGVVLAVAVYSGLNSVAYALLAPDRPAWRFLSVSDDVAHRAMRTVRSTGLVAAVFLIIQQLLSAVFAPFSVTVLTHGIRSLVFAGVLGLGLASVARIESREKAEREEDPYAGPPPAGRAIWRWLRAALWLATIAIAGSAIAGYAALGTFLSWQVVWVVLVIGALIVALRFVDDAMSEATRSGGKAGRRIADTFGLEPRSIEQLGIISSGLFQLILFVAAGFLVIAPWGVESRDAVSWVRALFFGMQVGGIRISILAVLLAVSIFALGLIATRAVQRWLDERLLPSTRMDVGLRNSIRTGIGYVGFVIAAMVGFTYLGIDVSNLAIVAGALSVGIGFGLQSIVSNFVSGLILLAERPIKAGDWIVASGAEGHVKRINVRATEIETFDRAVLIVPNSTLITGTVKNLMHDDILGRATIRVGVPYGVDADRVRDILLDIARNHQFVTCESEPKVFLSEFSDLGMVFELGCTVIDVNKSGGVKSDLRFEIARRFAAEQIPMRMAPAS